MAVEYKTFLAETVLNEHRTVTYRLLSRALKVHNNLAKQMLYEFHRSENAKKPRSVHATYIIVGVQRLAEKPARKTNWEKDGEDDIMQSSPFICSSMPQQDDAEQVSRYTNIVLAREEDMEGGEAPFLTVSSHQKTDLNVLTDVGHEMLATYGHEDPLEYGKVWGMIQNKHAKRRTGIRMPPMQPVSKLAASDLAAGPKHILKQEPTPQLKKEVEKAPTSLKSALQPTSARPHARPLETSGSLKRGNSDLFSSFAKSKPKQAKPAKPESKASTPAVEELTDGVNFGDDDNDDEDESEEREDFFLDTGERKSNKLRETRKEREEKLKRMMEDDDGDMPDTPAIKDEPATDKSPIEFETGNKPEPKEEIVIEGGRRRGRRQVVKKKTVKDEEGYLVTLEEPVWESFSEDEPIPPRKKKPAITATNTSKGKKPGQGNIMSFLSKK